MKKMEILEGYISLQKAGIPDHLCYKICRIADETCGVCEEARATTSCEVCRRKICKACSTIQTVYESGMKRRVCQRC